VNLIAGAPIVPRDSHRCQDKELKAIAQQAIQESSQKRDVIASPNRLSWHSESGDTTVRSMESSAA
jgi:hypothetical protein